MARHSSQQRGKRIAVAPTSDIVEFWREAQLDGPPFVHPADKGRLAREMMTWQQVNCDDPRSLHLDLLPQPYLGNLATADVFVLTYKPGFGAAGDEYGWEAREDFSAALRRSLRQEFDEGECPFIFLDPRWDGHPGSVYWRKRLNGIGALETLARRLAVLEVLPYHAKESSDYTFELARSLASARAIKNHFDANILPRARAGEVLVVAVRRVASWRLLDEAESDSIVKYGDGETRGAYLTSNTRGGMAIRRWLGTY